MAYSYSAQTIISVPSFVVAAQLARDGEQARAIFASIWRRYFDTLAVSSFVLLCCQLTGIIPAGQGYYLPSVFILFFVFFPLGLHLLYCDRQQRREREEYMRRLEDFQRWRDLPRWNNRRQRSPWYQQWQQMRREERANRLQVTADWLADEAHTASRIFYQRCRAMPGLSLYARPDITPSWVTRAANSMSRIQPRNLPRASIFLPLTVAYPPRRPGRRSAVVRGPQVPQPPPPLDSSAQQLMIDTMTVASFLQPRRNPPRAARPPTMQANTAQPPQPVARSRGRQIQTPLRRNPPRAARPRWGS